MATYDLTTSATAGVNTNQIQALPNHRMGREVKLIQYKFDVAKAIANGTVASTGVANGDVIKVGTMPAGVLVLNSGLEMITATGVGSSTADIGFASADPDCITDAGALDSAGYVSATLGINGLMNASNQFIRVTSDDTVQITVTAASSAFTVGVFRIYCVVLDISDYSTADEVDRDLLA
tara:strand:- start:6402 stop:6938 length:537 start_codon:yes stop_codon:yes gene_type:complete